VNAAERTQENGDPEALAESVRVLADRIEALQADVRRLGGPALPTGEPGWDDGAPGRAGPEPASHAWVGALAPRVRRRPAVPRLLLEILFLVAVAVGCGLGRLDAGVIVGVMALAWVLVGLIEWTSARADARRGDIVVTFATPEPAQPDPSWLVPPVERTLLDAGSSDEETAVGRLPAAPEDDESGRTIVGVPPTGDNTRL
jgi:hypothetical protein